MSLRYEQYRSLKMTRELLGDLIAEGSEEAGRCLKHFPMLNENGKPYFSTDKFTTEEGVSV